MQISGAIFDLDGTLVDTLPIVIESFRRAINTFRDPPISEEAVTQMFGPSEAGVLQRAIPGTWEEGLAVYLRDYEKLYIQRKIEPFPGIDAVLQLLRSSGVRTAVVTGKGAYSTAFSLRHAGLDGCFDLVQTGSPEGSVKAVRIMETLARWAIPPERAFYLGDSPSDIQDAHSTGVIALAAAWAETADQEALAAQHPSAMFTAAQDLIEWLVKSHDGPNGLESTHE